jgi:hypothetical protein
VLIWKTTFRLGLRSEEPKELRDNQSLSTAMAYLLAMGKPNEAEINFFHWDRVEN